jgi:transmembrane sensor
MMQSAKEIDDEAAGWALKLGDAAEPAGLQSWLDGDARRAGALLRAQAALSFIDRARALEPAPEAEIPAARSRRPAVVSRRNVLALGGAGGLMAAGLGAFAVLGAGARYQTDIGEIRRVPLKDGSVVDINTASAVDVTLRGRHRDVTLRQGEAWFQVAKDPSRPFVVSAGEAHFRAVGTAFSVRKLDGRAELLVTEGVVEARLREGEGVQVPAGSRIVVGLGLPLQVLTEPDQIERALAWRSGQISLDGLTLGQAAAEFNRYNRRPLVVENAALARQQFVGLFRVDDPHSFALAVSATSGAKIVEDDQAIRLR